MSPAMLVPAFAAGVWFAIALRAALERKRKPPVKLIERVQPGDYLADNFVVRDIVNPVSGIWFVLGAEVGHLQEIGGFQFIDMSKEVGGDEPS